MSLAYKSIVGRSLLAIATWKQRLTYNDILRMTLDNTFKIVTIILVVTATDNPYEQIPYHYY